MSSDNNVIISPEPMKPRVEYLKTLPGNNLAGALRCAIAQKKLHYADLPRAEIRVNGEIQPKTPEALDRCLLEGDLVLIEVKAHGDNPLRTAFQIFIQIGAVVVGVMFGPQAAAAVQIMGALLTNVLFPPNKPEQLADANDSGSLRDQSNNIRRRYPMPLVLGRQRIGFDVAAMGYTENLGNESWINVIFGVHYGPCQVTDIKIGETLLADYPASDYQIEYFLTPGPRNSNIYKQSKFQENMNNELDLHGIYEVATLQAGADFAEIDITLPNGLSYTTDKGKKQNEEVAGHIQYAEVGTEVWVNAGLPPVNDKQGVPMPAGSFYINARTQDAIRRTYIFTLPDQTKQYKVRVKAYDYDNRFDDTSVWETYWTAMRSVFKQKPIIDETLACIALRVKASGDLNGTLPVVSGMVTPIVPIYDGVDWDTTAPSSNMAACLRWALTGPPASTKLDVEEINASCAAAYELIEANDWDAALFITDEMSQEDLMRVCGAAGRFSTYWSGEDLCFVTDWEKPVPRQMFTAKNVSGYKYRREFQDEIHAVFVEFKNVDESSGADEVWVYADGYTKENATKFETIRLPYACTLERAYKEGRVYLAKRELKTESHEWTVAWDSVTATYGDRVKVAHHSALYGHAAGRVVNRWFNGDKTLVTGIRVDFLAEMLPGVDYSIDVRQTNEAIVGIDVVNVPGSSKTIMFQVPIAVADAPSKDDLVVFGETNIVTEDVEIDNFDYQDGVNVRISASPYIAELVEAAETGPIPPITTGLKPKEPAPAPRILSTRGLVDGVEVLFDVKEDQNTPIQGFVARWRYSTGTWNTLPLLGSDTRSFKTPPIQRPSYDPDDVDLIDSITYVDVQVITLLRRGDFSNPTTVEAIAVKKDVLAPTNFDAISVVRTSASGSSYPVIAVIADPITAGDIQYLDVEFAQLVEGEDFFDSAGQPLPASNPIGDFRNVSPSESYIVRGRFRTQDNWVSDWVYAAAGAPVVIPGGSNVADDSVNTGGVPSPILITRVVEVETLAANNAQAVADLEIIYGDTASAAASAAAAATSANAAIQAEADAVIAQGAAQSAATAAATSATNSAGSAAAALTSENSAATSATNSASSATTASGHASNASTSAGAAATSATNAGNSATAAAGSATTASTQATNASNSATAASASAVSAASSYNAALAQAESLLPERIDALGNYFVKGTTGTVLVPADIATLAGFGPVRSAAASGAVHVTKGFFPATTSKVYEVAGRVQIGIAGSGAPTARPILYAYDANFGYLGTVSGPIASAIAGGGALTTATARFSDTAPIGGTAWTAGAVWLRGGVILQADATTTVYVRSVSIRDVTAVTVAESQATAAATSASSAATSATDAGSSASAASTSATAAATSAGNASTSATQASNSATTASGHASTASTSATNAANSATEAGNSATAASGSASTAATHATNSGNSATAAAASAVSAASSYTATSIAAAMQFPDRYDGAESYFTGSMTGGPSVATLASNATEAGYGPVYDLTVVGSGSSDFGSRGLLPAIAGRIYKVEVEAQRTAITGAGATNATIRVRCLNSLYADVAATSASAVALTGAVQTFSAMFSDIAGTGITAWAVGSVWLRPHFRWQIGAGTTATVRVRRMTVTDVTEQIAAAASATAAATSASSASTSATNAGTSATAASTSATNAATSAGAASTSATNASNSATTASGHASSASTSATNAANSATAAGNSATAASGSASTAATSATNAGNSASAASASQVAAASSYAATLSVAALTLPSRIGANGEYFRKSVTLPTVVGDVFNLAGFGSVRTMTASGSVHVTEGRFPATAGKIYEITADVQLAIQGSGAPTVRPIIYGYDDSDANIGSTTGGSSTPLTVVGAVVTITRRYGAVAPAGGFAWPAGSVWLRAGSLAQADATSTLYVRETRIKDITEVVAAEVQATAAATSASSASTSATNAGTSATAASGSATTATTQAGNASTFATNASTSATNAGNSATASASSASAAGTSATAAGTSAATASTQASNASASAASASASAVLAAGMSTNALNKNARFVDFPTTPGVPTDWANSVNGVGTRVTGEIGGYAYQADGAAAAGSTIVSATSAAGSMSAASWYVIEAQVRLDLGALTGAGVRLRQLNAAAALISDQLLTFSTDTKNNTNAAIGAGTVGRTYRFAKLIQTAALTDRHALYADTHSALHGSIAGANRLTWFLCSVRPATAEEITSGVAVPALSASVAVLQGAVADIQGRTAAWLEQTVEAGSEAAAFVRLYAETSPGVETSDVSIGAREVHLYNQDGEEFLRALSVVGGNALFYGGLQANAYIRQGSGDGWPVALKSVPFSLTDGQAVSWNTTFDNLPAYTTAMNNLAALTTPGEIYDIRLINITNTGATAYCKIIVPGAPSTYNIAAAFAGGTSAPDYTVGVTNAARLESTDGTYDLDITTSWTTSYKNYTTVGSDPFDADFNGTVIVNIYALKSGVWTFVGTQVFEHFETYSGLHDSPAWISIGPSVLTQTRTVNLGTGVQAIGVEYAGQTGANGPYAAGSGSMNDASWQGAATASSTRTATPGGTLTRFTVIPQ